MKKLYFQYQLDMTMDQEVNHHYFSLKCIPKTEEGQKVQKVKTRINADSYSISLDSFSNKMIYGFKENPHQNLNIFIEGYVEVERNPYKDDHLLPVYKIPTPYTSIDENMIKLIPISSSKDKMTFITTMMNRIYNYMTYQKNVTNTKTKATEAFALKTGVCQDYAHIMLAMLRYLHIPCRYVAGIMENEAFTHAWVEAYIDGMWYGFDPTNNRYVDDMYIVFARGRDARDTLVNKGIYFGNSQYETQNIHIKVEEQ